MANGQIIYKDQMINKLADSFVNHKTVSKDAPNKLSITQNLINWEKVKDRHTNFPKESPDKGPSHVKTEEYSQ